MNVSEETFVELLWLIEEIFLTIEVRGTLHNEWMMLSRILCKCFSGFVEIFYLLGNIRIWVENEWI